MKSTSIAGILLIVLGALALAYQGITYTRREKVLDIGPIHATKDTEKTIPLPPILGGVAARLGELLCSSSARGKKLNGSFRLGITVGRNFIPRLPPGSRRGRKRPTKVSERTNFRSRNSDHGGQPMIRKSILVLCLGLVATAPLFGGQQRTKAPQERRRRDAGNHEHSGKYSARSDGKG